MLCPTPPSILVDEKGRPYFLWDVDMTVDDLRGKLSDRDPKVRACLLGKMMRQAKPDDVFLFVDRAAIEELWPRIEPNLGRMRAFWTWFMSYDRGRR